MSSSVLEGNELIAVFMGGKLSKKTSPIIAPHWKGLEFGSKIYDLYYDKRWDWLMPVVEKIELTNRVNDKEYYPYMVSIWKNCCQISDGNNGIIITTVYAEKVGNGKIAATYKAVVEFIKWYNKQNESNK